MRVGGTSFELRVQQPSSGQSSVDSARKQQWIIIIVQQVFIIDLGARISNEADGMQRRGYERNDHVREVY